MIEHHGFGDETGEVVSLGRPRKSKPPKPPKPPGRARAKRRWLPIVAAVGVVGTLGLGYYGVRTAGERNDAEAKAARLADDNRALTDALELHRASKVDLDTQLTTCKQDLDTEKTTATNTSAELVACQSNVEDLRDQKAEAKAIVAEFNGLTRRFQKMIDSGKLEVVFRRGEMVVKLPSRVLFPSGSATLSKGGEEALAEVAAVLKTMRHRRFTVAGHTDNVPIRSKEFANNWELSSARAVNVTQMLVRKGVRPRSLVAAGYGEFAPVATNKSKAGRQRNRRIEIILEPDLSKLPLRKLANESKKKKATTKKKSKVARGRR